MPRRHPRLFRERGYAAAVGPRRGHGPYREAVWPIRGVRQVRSSGGSAMRHGCLALIFGGVDVSEMLCAAMRGGVGIPWYKCCSLAPEIQSACV